MVAAWAVLEVGSVIYLSVITSLDDSPNPALHAMSAALGLSQFGRFSSGTHA
jgi:hypothetical protein